MWKSGREEERGGSEQEVKSTGQSSDGKEWSETTINPSVPSAHENEGTIYSTPTAYTVVRYCGSRVEHCDRDINRKKDPNHKGKRKHGPGPQHMFKCKSSRQRVSRITLTVGCASTIVILILRVCII